MPSNSFIAPGEITTLTFLDERPVTGVGQFGPYKCYKVRTADGADRMFFVPRYLEPELERVGISRGSVVNFRAEPARTKSGHTYMRIEVAGTGAPRGVEKPVPRRDADTADRILPSVALKAAAQTRGIAGEPQEVLAVADRYLAWLRAA